MIGAGKSKASADRVLSSEEAAQVWLITIVVFVLDFASVISIEDQAVVS